MELNIKWGWGSPFILFLLLFVSPLEAGLRETAFETVLPIPSILMAYHVPNLRDPDSYVLEVIATILSGGKSSRFYQNLVREKRLVLSADADHSLLSCDPYLFFLSADLLPGKEVIDPRRNPPGCPKISRPEKLYSRYRSQSEGSEDGLKGGYIYGESREGYFKDCFRQRDMCC